MRRGDRGRVITSVGTRSAPSTLRISTFKAAFASPHAIGRASVQATGTGEPLSKRGIPREAGREHLRATNKPRLANRRDAFIDLAIRPPCRVVVTSAIARRPIRQHQRGRAIRMRRRETAHQPEH